MFFKNIACLAVAMENGTSWILAKQAIFLQNIPWKNCSKSNFKQFSHSMSVTNIASLAVIIITKF